MELQTNISLSPESDQIDYTSEVLLLGSCFAQNIGDKLEYFKFRNTVNPFGIVFHPLAVERLLSRAVNKRAYAAEDIFQRGELWYCFEAHSEVRDEQPEALLTRLNSLLQVLRSGIGNATHIVLTLGTAWGYRHPQAEGIVANCHKVPQKEFSKELSSVEALSAGLETIVQHTKKLNAEARIIFTVSPVRHLKDGVVENSLSKAHLLSAVHKLLATHTDVSYFPAFEILMDELRDYRFYADDMIHPSAKAIDIIWERFAAVWISSETAELQNKIAEIQKGMTHRPFNPDSAEHKRFLEALQAKKLAVIAQLPHISF